MNRQQIKELLPIIQAYAEGKPIEIKTKGGKKWCTFEENDIQYLPIILSTCDFRIKPESKYRPFKNEEECWEEMLKHQPFGWIKCKEGVFHLGEKCGFEFCNSINGNSTFSTLVFNSPREAFASKICKEKGAYAWDSNPYMFVYDFKLI